MGVEGIRGVQERSAGDPVEVHDAQAGAWANRKIVNGPAAAVTRWEAARRSVRSTGPVSRPAVRFLRSLAGVWKCRR